MALLTEAVSRSEVLRGTDTEAENALGQGLSCLDPCLRLASPTPAAPLCRWRKRRRAGVGASPDVAEVGFELGGVSPGYVYS